MRMKPNVRSKKGISLVVVVVMCFFLVMSTTALTSMAIYQQRETGSEMNTRQAYVSAKSALSYMQELVEKKQLSVPAVMTEPAKYYILSYSGDLDRGTLNINTIDNAIDIMKQIKDKIKNLKEIEGQTVIGEDTYFKLTQDENHIYTMSAFSEVGKYTPDHEDQGDSSFRFKVKSHVKYEEVPEPTAAPTPGPTEGPTEETTGETPTAPEPDSVSNSTQFLMVGQQRVFYLRPNDNLDQDKLLHQYSNDDGISYIPWLEGESTPVKSNFPVVFDRVAKMNSDQARCLYQAPDSSIYFLGKYDGHSITGKARMKNAGAVCLFNENDAFSGQIECDLLVLSNNVALRCQGQGNTGITLKYSGTQQGRNGVILYMPNRISVLRYDYNSEYPSATIKYEPGYYYMPNGGNLMYQKATPLLEPSLLEHAENINLYDTITNMLDDGEIHSAQEGDSSIFGKVNMLSDDGKFTKDVNYFSQGSAPFAYPQDTGNYHIYAAPTLAPTDMGYYYLYAGKTMNFMWYRQRDMKIKNGVHLTLSGPDIVLTIGADTNDPNGPASNVLDGTGGNSSFNLCSYKDKGDSYNLIVMNKMKVKYPGGEYTIEKGQYNHIGAKLNLFSQEAAQYFGGSERVSSQFSRTALNYQAVGNINKTEAQALALPLAAAQNMDAQGETVGNDTELPDGTSNANQLGTGSWKISSDSSIVYTTTDEAFTINASKITNNGGSITIKAKVNSTDNFYTIDIVHGLEIYDNDNNKYITFTPGVYKFDESYFFDGVTLLNNANISAAVKNGDNNSSNYKGTTSTVVEIVGGVF